MDSTLLHYLYSKLLSITLTAFHFNSCCQLPKTCDTLGPTETPLINILPCSLLGYDIKSGNNTSAKIYTNDSSCRPSMTWPAVLHYAGESSKTLVDYHHWFLCLFYMMILMDCPSFFVVLGLGQQALRGGNWIGPARSWSMTHYMGLPGWVFPHSFLEWH
jgi:hypothetical protein